MDHLVKLIDAIHILSGTSITDTKLHTAQSLLIAFVEDFEILYGEKNMVYNIHQLKHLVECVRRNGPLSTYSNNAMEDKIGHMVTYVNGTTDVTSQILSKYLLEQNLMVSMEKYPRALQFFEQIERKLSFPISEKLDGSLLIGKPKEQNVMSENHASLLQVEHSITTDLINEYRAVLLNCKMFYETDSNSIGKRTNDSLIYNNSSEKFGIIKSILRVNESIYFLVNEQFCVKRDSRSDHIIFLEETTCQTKLLKSDVIGEKYVYIRVENRIAVSKFPNLFERN